MTDPRRPTDEDELDADEFDADEFPEERAAGAEEDVDAAAETRRGARVPRAAGRPAAGRAVPERGSAPAAAGEELPYVDDRVSKIWIALIVAVFAAIFVYGLLLGRGGLLTSAPSPAPTATEVPSSAPSPARTQTLRPSVSPAASVAASGSPQPTTAGSPPTTASPPTSPATSPPASP